jgi:hypothetical protein
MTGNSWVSIGVAVDTCDWLGDTVSESLSLWSVWAMLETGWVSGTSWDVSWDNICWPWALGKSVWPWGTGNSWINIGIAVDTCDGFGDTVSEGLSFWKVWAMFESGWVGGSGWDVSWGNVCWPWALSKSVWPWMTGNSWVSIGVAVDTCDWLGDTVSESLSFWSVWAMFETGWVCGTSWDVSWDNVCWPWALSKSIWPWCTSNSWISIGIAVDTCDWLGDTVSESLSLWSVWAMFETGWVGGTSWDVSWDNVGSPWSLSKGPGWVAIETSFWIWNSHISSIS